MNKLKTLDFWIEVAASVTTLAGIYIGSTTLHGALFYLFAIMIWYVLIWRQKLWGLIPLNVGSNIIAVLNIVKALGLPW